MPHVLFEVADIELTLMVIRAKKKIDTNNQDIEIHRNIVLSKAGNAGFYYEISNEDSKEIRECLTNIKYMDECVFDSFLKGMEDGKELSIVEKLEIK
ncbi:hypothetical protein [Enterovibrio norvegicus]|uniref:Uncharacterized protein n=1 Tax=Enterovibrio norvegicus TaxID=188144 RepID=A0ABV4L7J8_9GAMM